MKIWAAEEAVREALFRMSEEMDRQSGDAPLALITILKGGAMIGTHLIEALSYLRSSVPGPPSDIVIGNIGLSSYEDKRSAGQVMCTSKLDLSADALKGRTVWLMDDIYDTGGTLIIAAKNLEFRGRVDPENIKTATLIVREEGKVDVHGFLFPGKHFFVGWGMGDGEKNRAQLNITSDDEESN